MTKDTDQKTGLAKTRAEARERGEKHYFTGEPCKYGHVDIRYTSSGECAECTRIKSAKYRSENAVMILEKWRIRWSEGKDAETRRKWRDENRQAISERERARRASDPEYHIERSRKWRNDNPEKYKEGYRLTYQRKKSTAQGKLEYSLSSGVRRGIVKGSKYGRRTFELLGYTLEELMAHLEKRFSEGMSWDNYGEWHIDHILPLASFEYETPDDPGLKLAWSLSNLQPLWAMDNWKKSAKITTPAAANDNVPAEGEGEHSPFNLAR
ncbi:hypothetical protein ABIA16_003820 [Sinorhizobium fredii]